ncbi:SH3 domain-containing protein [Jannaschia seosinensis]|uniref:SH3 domain-containing protein n=1 Tax=Jannaschia seosinensis TaxID=313367 RepID=A0A0M7BDW4_9RHOB|nr:SH3 domain-containing protein [Jannaschia seosinensis]CUH40268.1 SH3 domain-containing protein [Jannaschia seosinensis]
MRFLLPALLLATGAAAQDLYVADSDEGYLNLRGGPGTHHDIVRRLEPGDRVSVEEEMGRWARVRLPSGERGWASLDYLEQGSAPSGDALFVSTTGAGWLNLRSGPGTQFEVLRRMYPGDRLVSLERQGDWLRIRHVSGATGWAHRDYVTR